MVFALAAAHVTNPVVKKIYEECHYECSIKVSKLDAHWIPCVPNCMEVKLKVALKSQKDSRSFLEKILAGFRINFVVPYQLNKN
ncbi:unnamed protein product [Cylicocyclus nassatus]|uniref:Uncharacterized protein n=1 Tax=Cylicocyclus nassatus TaxID=53992 RepID=A0AA36HB22_CYLNA|nr:unnamed protein product [Cylicocyclus nassatus]